MPPAGWNYRISSHVHSEMRRRGIAEETVRHVFLPPEEEMPVRPGRDLDRDVPEVVTVYRTSKVEKYWRATT